MARAILDRRRLVLMVVVSAGVHGLLAYMTGTVIVAHMLARPAAFESASAVVQESPGALVEIELPIVQSGVLVAPSEKSEPVLEAPPRGGREALARPDSSRQGRGGTKEVEAPAINLADRDSRALLEPEVQSRFDRNQFQRMHTGNERRTREDWRASREPMSLTFMATGSGARPERTQAATSNPSAGLPRSGKSRSRGARRGSEPLPAGMGEVLRDPGGPVSGAVTRAAGSGVRDGIPGRAHRDGAALATGRPLVADSTPSVPAAVRGAPSDNADSEQEVATAIQSIVHASSAGGDRGSGAGGEPGSGAPGSGGTRGSGSRSTALGTGAGPSLDVDLRDARRSDYLRRTMAKIHPLWADAFPHWAALEGLQGTVVVAFVIAADGHVESATIARSSGIAEFDENCRRAVLRGAPYDPLPSELGPSLRWWMPFDARNPAVRPKYTGDTPP